MQRFAVGFTLLLPLIAACTHDGERAASARSGVSTTAAAIDQDVDRDAPASEARPPRLTLVDSNANARLGKMTVKGRLEDADLPGVFRLRGESGCARDVRLETTTTGIGFNFTMGETELGDAFACAIDADVGDRLVASLTVTPDALVANASPALSFDGLSVASLDLEPRSDQVVRVSVLSTEEVRRASLRVGGVTVGGSLFPSGDQTSVTFEVPVRAWARASITGDRVDVSVTTASGPRSLELHPFARIELAEDE